VTVRGIIWAEYFGAIVHLSASAVLESAQT